MSWLYSHKMLLQYVTRYDNVLAYFSTMEVSYENMPELSSRIQAEKERARILFPVMCQCEKGKGSSGEENRPEGWMGVQEDDRQRWICQMLWCFTSILKRSENDARAHNGNGIIDWATNRIKRGCSPQEWEQARQQVGKSGIDDAARAFIDAWPENEERERSGWKVCVNLPSLQALVAAYSGEPAWMENSLRRRNRAIRRKRTAPATE